MMGGPPVVSDQVLLRVNSAKVNNGSNKLSVQDSSPSTASRRKSSDSGQLRALLEDKNGARGSSAITTNNGHIMNSVRKLSADFRLNHRDLLSEENGKHLGNKPVRMKNLANKTEAYDMLHNKTVEKVSVTTDKWKSDLRGRLSHV